jgi:hypothetical protein
MIQKVEILVKGRIDEGWSEWFDGLIISHPNPDETMVTGLVPDAAALYGIIARVRDLGLQLCSVRSEEVREGYHE